MEPIARIIQRIEEKRSDYDQYGFSRAEDNALKAFFDLAQELDATEDFLSLCVTIPKCFFSLEARLFLITPKANKFTLLTATEDSSHIKAAPDLPAENSARVEGSLVLKIRGKKLLVEQLPFLTQGDVIGILELYPESSISEHDCFFFEKFANRIGFNLHNRYLVEKNVEHLNFIRSLVADIEHNIIAPNMVYRLYLKNLETAVTRCKALEARFRKQSADNPSDRSLSELAMELAEVNWTVESELDKMNRHYRDMSLFLETLLRRSHFDQGRLTLRTKRCNMYRDVVAPQIDRLRERFQTLGIAINFEASGIPEKEVISVVDVGLMAQVYANLFSNALKYSEEVGTRFGVKKYVAYGFERIRDYFGPGKSGLKFNVFSTGTHIKPEERGKVFQDNYRGANAGTKPGTGHGLAFIKNVVEIHGGAVGYEPTEFGNNFFFILPE